MLSHPNIHRPELRYVFENGEVKRILTAQTDLNLDRTDPACDLEALDAMEKAVGDFAFESKDFLDRIEIVQVARRA